MRKIITILFFFACFAAASSLLAQIEVPESAYNMENSNLGREFYVAFPQNDVPEAYNDESGQGNFFVDMAIYVTSYKNTSVTITLPNGTSKTKDVIALENTIFSVNQQDFPKNLEIDSSLSEIASKRGIHVESTDPVIVYVVSSRIYSEELYLALPVESWGNEYIHCSSYDYNYGNLYRAGGFIVLASENNTIVDVELRGRGNPDDEYDRTQKKHYQLGDKFSVTLKKGETFMVQGAARTRSKFDFSGSLITASKPVGLISFHHNSRISGKSPSTSGEDSRNNIMEMLPPISQWGKEFFSLEFFRTGKKGDYFRVMASEDETNWSVTLYDVKSGDKIDEMSGTLAAGEFYEYNTIDKQNPLPSDAKAIRGIAHWTSDKPIMLMQYAYSENWDNDSNWDPVMTVVPPAEQFLHAAVGSFPVENDFKSNDLYLIFKADAEDENILKGSFVNGYQITMIFPSLLDHQIADTDYFWLREVYPLINNNAFSYYGKAAVGGILTGVSDFKPYARPFAMGTSMINSDDKIAPGLEFIDDDGETFNYKATEENEVDLGISKITLDEDWSNNFELTHDAFKPQNKVTSVNFSLKITDKDKNASAYFYILDRAGNVTHDSLKVLVSEDKIEMFVEDWVADTVKVGTKLCYEKGLTVINRGKIDFTVTKITVPAPYSISDPTAPALPYIVKAGDTAFFKELCFLPTEEAKYFLEGRVEINDGEIKYPFALMGYGSLGSDVEENPNKTYLKVFPRPSNNQDVTVFLNLVERSNIQIDLFDQEGNKVMNMFNNTLGASQKSFTIPVSSLSSGVYYVKMNYNGGTITEKVIINK
jgi:IgGFc binding protein/type IX secretion system substrate protein